jgi:hypothetical protein
MRDTAKDIMLDRIRKGIANAPEHSPIPHDFRERDERDRAAILEDFIDRLVDYKAIVTYIKERDHGRKGLRGDRLFSAWHQVPSL